MSKNPETENGFDVLGHFAAGLGVIALIASFALPIVNPDTGTINLGAWKIGYYKNEGLGVETKINDIPGHEYGIRVILPGVTRNDATRNLDFHGVISKIVK